MNIYYHKLYTDGIDEKSSFPRDRYRLVKQSLESNQNSQINILKSEKADLDDIYRAHSKQYVKNFLNGNLSDNEIRQIGLKPWSDSIVDRTLLITGGSLMALKDIYYGAKIAGNMAGGTHHAFYDRGSGFCIFNDIAICALKAIDCYKYKKIVVIDLDVHQGDGTASILSNRKDIFTFSMHCEKNFPFKKVNSDLDLPLKERLTDEEYLDSLKLGLHHLDSVDSNIIFFQAGVDSLGSDRYGKLNLSLKGLDLRNELIFNFARKRKNPIIIFMGGGYSNPINHSVDAFSNLFAFFSSYNF
mgnify:CR=1 FL=1|tara:strand:+ start:2731 stop:3630 length:900 start_codon:yes stop_codon:yes gene_type:complete